MIEMSSISVNVNDLDGNLLYVNPVTRVIYGCSRENLFDENLRDVDSPKNKAFFEQRMVELQKRKEISFEVQLYKNSLLLEENEDLSRLFLTLFHQIADNKRDVARFQRINDLLRAMIDTAPVAIIGLDLDGIVHSAWNPVSEKMLGWRVEEAIGHLLPSMLQEKEGEFSGFYERISYGLTSERVEVRRQWRDGTPIDYSIYASPLRNSPGAITGNIMVFVDISECKRIEEIPKVNEEMTSAWQPCECSS